MRRLGKSAAAVSLAVLLNLWAVPNFAATAPPALVARVAHVDGDLLRYVPDEDDWVLSGQDSPLGPKDVFYSDRAGRAEFTFPNRTMMRLGNSTQVEVVAIENDLTDVYVGSGQARLYNRGSDTYFRASTPFGYVVAPPGARADMYVGDESVEVISLGGTVQFVHTKGGFESKYDLSAGSASLIADREYVTSGDGSVDADWDGWNGSRDALWRQRAQVKPRYVPEPLYDDAYALEENGRWDRVYYDNSYRYLWRPTVIAAGWTPFTVGRWSTWYGEQVWVPHEPFGYVTHHYGNWVMAGGGWYWMPPVVAVRVGVPHPPLYWYPGRVAWLHADAGIGWVPLAPHEVYYGHRHWGPAAAVYTVGTAAITLGTLAFVSHAVVVDHRHFYGFHDYSPHKVVVNKTTIINNYYASPVVNKTVLKGVPNVKQQYNFVNREVKVKPHQMVTTQVKQRLAVEKPSTRAAITTDLQKAQTGQLAQGKTIKEPKVTSRIVQASDVNKPQVQFNEVKPKSKGGKPQSLATAGETLGRPEEKGKGPKDRPSGWDKGRKEGLEGTAPPGLEKEKPGKPGKPGKPAEVESLGKPEGVEKPRKPGRPAEVETLGKPAKPGKPGKPADVETLGQPEKPRKPGKPVPPESVGRPEGGVQQQGKPHVERAPQDKPQKEQQGDKPQKGKKKVDKEKEQD